MNILFVIKNDALLEELNSIIQALQLDWKILIPTDSQHCMDIYNYTSVNMVLIDFSIGENGKILEEIISINPSQKTLTVSNYLLCSDKNGCENCIMSFNRRRLLLPIDPTVLYNAIANFDAIQCEYFKKFENILNILPKILERFKSYKYDETNKLIYKDDNLSSFINNEFVQILSLLDTYEIQYKLLDNNNIQILV